jgi:hypothetical protein
LDHQGCRHLRFTFFQETFQIEISEVIH